MKKNKKSNLLCCISHLLYTDFVKAHKGIKAVKKNVSLDHIMQMRQEASYAYIDFVEYFVSAVIGNLRFKQNCCDNLLSQYATVSDEAFAILIMENNYGAWVDMGLRKDTSSTEAPWKYTNGGKAKGEVASSQHNRGWSEQGMQRFNELFDKVKKNRKADGALVFEEKLRSYCEDRASDKKKRAKVLPQELFAVRHELWSDNEDGEQAKAGDAEGPVQKKTKTCSNDASGGAMVTVNKNNNATIQQEEAEDSNDIDFDEENSKASDDETEDEGDQPDSDGLVPV